MVYRSLSLFSGAGGLDFGFHSTGHFQTIACYERDKDFCQTLKLNHDKLVASPEQPELPRIVDADLSDRNVLDEIQTLEGDVDVVFGGPPCQSFSIMGKKSGVDDERGALVYSFLDVVNRVRPKAFLFENVPNFMRMNGGRLADGYRREFEKIGYSLWSGLLNAADFGARTFRSRFFIIGVYGDVEVAEPSASHFQGDQPDLLNGHSMRPWKTCARVFEEIRLAEESGVVLFNHDTVNHSAKTISRFDALSFGETDHVRKRNRLDPNRPSHSIYVGGRTGKLQARTHIHPYLPRELTARECALIQGFPIDWKFYGRRDSAVLQAANAVPVPLARALANHIVVELDSSSISGTPELHSEVCAPING